MLVLTKDDLRSLSTATQDELKKHFFPSSAIDPAVLPNGFSPEDFEGVVDLSPGQVEELMKGCSDETIAGLKVIAENGPVIHATLLDQAGIENYGHFQGRVTKRTRTVTSNRRAYLFGWDDWSEFGGGIGHYAVTPATFRSLRIFFRLD